MEWNDIIGYAISFIAGGGLITLITARSAARKAGVDVKKDEIQALHDTIESVYEPLIKQQKVRIVELDAEVKSLREQLATERADRQRDMEMMNKRILAITSALGIKAAQQLRDEKGRFTPNVEEL